MTAGVQFTDDGLIRGVGTEWIFDPEYSAMAIEGLDTDKDGKYSAAELIPGAGTRPDVRVTVRNTGSRPSREVVQVYFRPAQADQPVRLVGWAAVTVDPGAEATVTVTPATGAPWHWTFVKFTCGLRSR